MTERRRDSLADHTTLRVGGRPRTVVTATTEAELVDGRPRRPTPPASRCWSSAAAPTCWSATTASTAPWSRSPPAASSADVAGLLRGDRHGRRRRGLGRPRRHRGRPGVGRARGPVRHPRPGRGTPIQNVGAYGAEVSQTDLDGPHLGPGTGRAATFSAVDCGFGYRTSRFKAEPGRYLVLVGHLPAPARLAVGARSATPSWPDPRRRGRRSGRRPPRSGPRCSRLRAGKGMVLDAADHDTWSAGSFFTNPILDAGDGRAAAGRRAAVPPARRAGQDQRGLADRARRVRQGLRRRARPGCPTKHTLALTNRGGARAADVLGAGRARSGPACERGVRHQARRPEPVLVGVRPVTEEWTCRRHDPFAVWAPTRRDGRPR